MGEFTDSVLNSDIEIREVGLEAFVVLGNAIYETRDVFIERGVVDFKDIYELFIRHYIFKELISDGVILEGYRDDIVNLSQYDRSGQVKLDRIDYDVIAVEDYVCGIELADVYLTFRSEELVRMYEEVCEYVDVLRDRIVELEREGKVDFSVNFVTFRKLRNYFDMVDSGLELEYVFPVEETLIRSLVDTYSELSLIYYDECDVEVLVDVVDREEEIRRNIEIVETFLEETYETNEEIGIFDSLGKEVSFVDEGTEFHYGPCRFDVGIWDMLEEADIMIMWLDDIKAELKRRV